MATEFDFPPDNPRRATCARSVELLEETDVAELLRVSTATLRAWRRRGIGPIYLKLSGAVRYDLADIHEWLRTRRVDPVERDH